MRPLLVTLALLGAACGTDRAGTELYCDRKGACVPRQVFCIKAPCPPVMCP